ncbi:MAG: 6-bladed beta-propeller [Thermodesulfovibrionales bacterium]
MMSKVLLHRGHGAMQRAAVCSLWLLPVALCLFNSGCTTAVRAQVDDALAGKLVWPAPPETPRVEYLWSLYAFLPEGEKESRELYEELDAVSERALIPYLLRPNSLAVDGSGRLFILDQGVPRVSVVDLKTKNAVHFGTEGEGRLIMPVAVATDAKENVYVTESETSKVNRYSADGRFTGVLGTDGLFKRPTGIACDSKSGRVFVVDTGAQDIKVLDSTGRYLFDFGRRGDGDGEFNYPTHIAADQNGKLYVTDALNFRIQIFDQDGRFLGKFGRHGDTYADFERPKGIAADTFGNIYVADAAQDMIKIFDSHGKLLLFLGETGRLPGNFIMPLGISIDNQNNIYVTDTYNMRVQAFRLIRERGR